MRTVQVVHTVVFARDRSGGNPCPVVTGAAGLTDGEMQGLAARFGQETAFVLPPDDPRHAARLRFFVPRYETDMCVHATIGVARWLLDSGRLPPAAFAVGTSIGPVTVIPGPPQDPKSPIWVDLRPAHVLPLSPPRPAVAQALGIGEAGLAAWPVKTVSTSRFKTLIPLTGESCLQSLRPDPEALWALCERYGSTGLYPFAFLSRSPGVLVAARQFPLRAGYLEDPATGVAAAALAAYLVQQRLVPAGADGWARITVRQGDAMGRPSRLVALARRGEDGRMVATRVGGTAAILGRETVPVPDPGA